MRRSQNGAMHSSFDCVWGFTQIGIDEKTSELLALNTRRGLLLPKVLYFGAKQGPGIFQALADSVFSHLKYQGKEFVTCFVDDCSISTELEPGETNESDSLFERHLDQLELFFTAVHTKKIQFK